MNCMCPQCGFNIQIEDSQVPPYPFAVDCPRCRKSVAVTPPAKPDAILRNDSAVRGGKQPAGAASQVAASPPPQNNPNEMMQTFMQMMATMMAGAGSPKATEAILQKGFVWHRKNMLICCADSTQRQIIENSLDKIKFETTSPQTSAQATEIMHDLKVDMVILDPQFDSARQGGISILRNISSLMPKYRRRMYVVLVSPQVKTLDTYMAFLNCVNLTVNTDDLESLPVILEKSIKDYNELYRPMYEAANLTPI
jgi:hypothetical protein